MKYKTLLASMALAITAVGGAFAADYPEKPIRIFIPYAAGGSTDVFLRAVGQELSERWGQPVVAENRPAGNTVVASYDLTQAPADGYTMGVITSGFAINPGVRSNLPYDTLEDFSGVSYILQIPTALVVHPDFPADTLEEFIEYALAETDPVLVAQAGMGTLPYMFTLLFADHAGFEVEPITYNGSAEAITDVLSGTVPVFVDAYSFVKPYVESGDLKLLSFFTPERLPDAPDTPVIAEIYPDVSGAAKIGLKVRAGTPDDIVAKLSEEIQSIVQSPEMSAFILERGAYPLSSSPEETDADIALQVERWTAVAADAGIRLD